MSIKIRCKVCQAGLKLPDAAMGKVVKCPKCATRIKVPLRGGGGASAPPRRRSRDQQEQAPPSSTGFLSALDSLPHEDEEQKICPRCGQEVDPEIGECDDCGIDVETGQPTKKRLRQMAQKGEDTSKFFKNILNDFFVFPFKNPGLMGRGILVSLFAYFLFAISRFFIFFSEGVTLELFMWVFISIAAALVVGWFWTLASEFVTFTFLQQRALKKKKTPKPFRPKPFDMFLVFQNGYRFAAWIICNIFVHSLILFPLILLLVIISLKASENGLHVFLVSMGVLLGISLIIVFLSIPLAIGHMAMPVTWPGWNPFKLAQLVVVRAPGATLVWGLMTLLFLTIPIGAYSAGSYYVSEDLEKVWKPMHENARIVAVQRKYFAPDEEPTDEEKGLLKDKPNKDVDYMLWLQSEMILMGIAAFGAIFYIGSARSVGNLVYFFQDKLDLIQDAPGVSYRVIDKKKYLPIPFRSNVGMVWLISHLLFGLEVAIVFLAAILGGIPISYVFLGLFIEYVVFFVPVMLLNDGLCRVFEKTKHNGLIVFLPYYREYVLFKVADLSLLWYFVFLTMNLGLGFLTKLVEPYSMVLAVLIFGANFIGHMIIWTYLNMKLAERFEKPLTFGLGLAFLSPVFYFILGRNMDRAKRLKSDPPPEFDDDDLL